MFVNFSKEKLNFPYPENKLQNPNIYETIKMQGFMKLFQRKVKFSNSGKLYNPQGKKS